MKTIHLILNSHIDPVWLWPESAGVDVVLNTCRSVCDILEENPDLIFTCGQAWTYQQVERCAPELFTRIRRLHDKGQWHLVGGWWIQPDCNLPTASGLRMQIELGRRYFLEKFGTFPKTAYNIDSFGHTAFLPRFLRQAGQSHYVMMRPQEHEMKLPARMFRWRCGEDEVLTFRIAGGYSEFGRLSPEHFQRALTDLPDGVNDTMCFIGAGDHGGGPTRKLVEFCRENASAIPGARLVFSTPDRFFSAIAPLRDRLPVVEGELQHHAIGCYSVVREIKRELRRAEHLLDRADPEAESLQDAWRDVCFNEFHDILAGSSIESAYVRARDQIGSAACAATDLLSAELRRQRPKLGECTDQRIALWNPGQEPFAGIVRYETWAEGRSFDPREWALLDESGERVPHQLVEAEAAVPPWLMAAMVFRVNIDAGALRVLRLARRENASSSPHPPPLPQLDLRLELIPDLTDTWSHGVDRYAGAAVAVGSFGPWTLRDAGPLTWSWIRDGVVGSSEVREERRVVPDEQGVEVLLEIDWHERHKILKLTHSLASPVVRQVDGVCGGMLERKADGRELPLLDVMHLEFKDGSNLGVVCPDVYAADVTESAARLTLLRSPVFAHHDPQTIRDFHRPTHTDRDVHRFRFRFIPGADVEQLQKVANAYNRPPLIMEMTEGMGR